MSTLTKAETNGQAQPTTNRLNGTTKPASKSKPKPKSTPKRKRPTRRKRKDHLKRWATAYVALAAIMSCGLNAMANGQHAPGEFQAAAWAMGAAIPVLVLLMGKVSGLLYHRRHRRGAAALATVCVCVLGLSVFHCEQSIAMLTGSNHVLSALLAIGIDCGLVGCEAAAMIDDR